MDLQALDWEPGTSLAPCSGTLFALLVTVALSTPLFAEENYVPEEGSVELDKKKARKKRPKAKPAPINPELPNVLIIGDSISMGYTKIVAKTLSPKANVIHSPGNSQGTTHRLANVTKWLAPMKWDVIHFNFGLHDLKRVVEAGTSKNSNDVNDPYQADLTTYSSNLENIVNLLKATNAKLIFATTTPFPAGVKPHRTPADAANYNRAALEIMKANHVVVNDLYAVVQPELKTLQKKVNVHFLPEGSQLMADQVVKHIETALAK